MNAINAIGTGEDVSEVIGKILRGGNQTRTTSETLPQRPTPPRPFSNSRRKRCFGRTGCASEPFTRSQR